MRICSRQHEVSDNANFCGKCGEHLDPQYPAGWYPNPEQAGHVDYWDGSRWAVPPQHSWGHSQSLIPQTTADALLSRRRTWNGAVVRATNLHPSNPWYGHHYRVRDSWRDPDTEAWSISWDPEADHLGTEPPEGEAVYVFDGTTWDLPAVPKTVFPYVTTILCLIGFVAIWPIDYAIYGNYQAAIMFGGVFLVQPLWTWFQRVEPTRATKVAAVYMAASAARRAQRTNSDAGAADVNQSVRETAQSLWPKPAEPTERVRPYGAIDPLTPGWDKPPPPDAHIVPWGES